MKRIVVAGTIAILFALLLFRSQQQHSKAAALAAAGTQASHLVMERLRSDGYSNVGVTSPRSEDEYWLNVIASGQDVRGATPLSLETAKMLSELPVRDALLAGPIPDEVRAYLSKTFVLDMIGDSHHLVRRVSKSP